MLNTNVNPGAPRPTWQISAWGHGESKGQRSGSFLPAASTLPGVRGGRAGAQCKGEDLGKVHAELGLYKQSRCEAQPGSGNTCAPAHIPGGRPNDELLLIIC